ncbi:MAG: hypothetical protein ACT4P1_11315 [Sporichthyaceae bacterium]
MFGKKSAVFTPVASELDEQWFTTWARNLLERKAQPLLVENVAALFTKAAMVIDHDCRTYVERCCSKDGLDYYLRYRASDELTPWGLVAVTLGARRDGDRPTRFNVEGRETSSWSEFVLSDVKSKIARFTEIMIDPSVAG